MPRRLGRSELAKAKKEAASKGLTQHKTIEQIRIDFLGSTALFVICLGILGGIYYFDQTSPLLGEWSIKVYEFLGL